MCAQGFVVTESRAQIKYIRRDIMHMIMRLDLQGPCLGRTTEHRTAMVWSETWGRMPVAESNIRFCRPQESGTDLELEEAIANGNLPVNQPSVKDIARGGTPL